MPFETETFIIISYMLPATVHRRRGVCPAVYWSSCLSFPAHRSKELSKLSITRASRSPQHEPSSSTTPRHTMLILSRMHASSKSTITTTTITTITDNDNNT